MNHLLEFIGRLHPMLVHLPIGILILVITWILIFEFKKKKVSRSVLNLHWQQQHDCHRLSLHGLPVITTGEYDETILSQHQWLGLSVAFHKFCRLYFFSKCQIKRRSLKLFQF